MNEPRSPWKEYSLKSNTHLEKICNVFEGGHRDKTFNFLVTIKRDGGSSKLRCKNKMAEWLGIDKRWTILSFHPSYVCMFVYKSPPSLPLPYIIIEQHSPSDNTVDSILINACCRYYPPLNLSPHTCLWSWSILTFTAGLIFSGCHGSHWSRARPHATLTITSSTHWRAVGITRFARFRHLNKRNVHGFFFH